MPTLPPLHVASVLGLVLGVLLLARELRARRAPAVTLAWFLAIVLVPYLGVPMYLVFGGRKMRRRAASKEPLYGAAGAAKTSDPPIERLLGAAGVAPTTHDNRVTLLGTGEEAYAATLDVVDGAKKTLHVATFILGGDEVGDAVLARMAARAKEGVEVRLLLDAFFSFRASRRALDELRKAGGRVAFFMPLLHVPFRGRSNLRNHRKIVVADGARAIVGGMNLAEEYMGPTPITGRWRDVSLRVEGGAAADLGAIFAEDWAFADGERLRVLPRATDGPANGAGAPLRIVASGPDVATDTLYDAILFALFSAAERIWIATPYFVPDEALFRALTLACRRGVDVRIVVPSPSNHLSADLAGATYLRAIERAGGAVRPYTAGMLHAKVIVIDRALAMVGSANLDMRSLFLNYEVMAVAYGAREIELVAEWFDGVLVSCAQKMTPAGRARAVAEDVGRLLGPLV
jgi:cardiolipin synthase